MLRDNTVTTFLERSTLKGSETFEKSNDENKSNQHVSNSEIQLS